MIAKSFRSVGWVAGVAVAALSCYMVSLKVASERADVATLEARIVAARQDIRSLQTELGTRGRMQQLERWNAEVLALSAPVSGQYVENEVMLARFDVRQPSFEQRTRVQLASAEAGAAPRPQPAPPPAAQPTPQLASLAGGGEEPAERPQQPMVRRAALVETAAAAPPPAVRRTAANRRERLLDDRAVEEIGRAERSERRSQEAAD